MIDKWGSKKEEFDKIDARDLKGDFLAMILKKAKNTKVGEGLCIIQSFEPIPLYSVMEDLGFEYQAEKKSDAEYYAYFYKVSVKEEEGMPLKPTAILNFKTIDNSLADLVVHFWELVWAKENSAIDKNTKYLLSLSNAVGAGRIRQAVREFVKAYSNGVKIEVFDELFTMFVWNQGVGNFASEIGPSVLFAAYKFVKEQEERGLERDEIKKELLKRYGSSNEKVNPLPKMR
ncbi:MAG: DUF2249 domain-containing protein [Clostridiales bacterium]|nr:DUF2249 domain-containing protein [Clostridiales bacterium]